MPFYPPNNLENQNFEKMRKIVGDIIILHMCTINDHHVIYGSWDMECGRQNFVILGNFLPFYPNNNLKNKNLEKMKNTLGDIIILHKYTKNHNCLLYCSWDNACDRCNFYWGIFCSFTPLTVGKIKIFKKRKKLIYQKLWSHEVWFLRYGAQRTDGRTDGWKKRHIEVGAQCKNDLES